MHCGDRNPLGDKESRIESHSKLSNEIRVKTRIRIVLNRLDELFSTRLSDGTEMTDEILLMRQEGVKKTVVGYRPAQKIGLYLEASDAALRVPRSLRRAA